MDNWRIIGGYLNEWGGCEWMIVGLKDGWLDLCLVNDGSMIGE